MTSKLAPEFPSPGFRHPFRFRLTAGVLLGIAAAPLSLGAQCAVGGQAPTADLAAAQAACDRVNERFVLLFGSLPPAGTLEISDTVVFFAVGSQAPEWKLIWPTTSAMERFHGAGRPAGDRALAETIEMQWSTVLPHEIAHLMLGAEVELRRATGPRRSMPDWLQEGVAVYMEPPGYRSGDAAMLRALRPYIPRLEDLLTLSIADAVDDAEGGSTIVQTFYPCASEEACGGRAHWSRIFSVTTRQFPDGRIRVDTTVHAEPPRLPTPLEANFYAYAAMFVRYLSDQGGPAAMSALIDRLARMSGEVSLDGLPGLPSGPARIEGDWRSWFGRWVFAN